MNEPILSLQIASGILMAVVIVWVFKLGVAHFQRGDYSFAFYAFAPAVLLGGGLILAGVGLVSW